MKHDLIIKNGTVVFPFHGEVKCELGVKDGRIATIADEIETNQADEVLDARGKYVFPGAVDSHYHIGIYRPHSEDAESESRSALVGGVSTIQVRKSGSVEDEINVIGKNVEEAISELDNYIDGALLAETATFRVVHGKGTGTLRRAIHDFLARHSSVIEYSIASPNEGGEGATVVSLG